MRGVHCSKGLFCAKQSAHRNRLNARGTLEPLADLPRGKLLAHLLEIKHSMPCPTRNATATLTGTVLVSGDSGTLMSEKCDLRQREFTLGRDCDRACGLGSAKSPLRKHEF